jgi:hypothetical protein
MAERLTTIKYIRRLQVRPLSRSIFLIFWWLFWLCANTHQTRLVPFYSISVACVLPFLLDNLSEVFLDVIY